MRETPSGALCAIKVHGFGRFFRLSEARRQQGEGSFPNALQINNCALHIFAAADDGEALPLPITPHERGTYESVSYSRRSAAFW